MEFVDSVPRNNLGKVLKRELLDYEIRVSENANDSYGAFKVGTHDDLVTALGLSGAGRPAGAACSQCTSSTTGLLRTGPKKG